MCQDVIHKTVCHMS